MEEMTGIKAEDILGKATMNMPCLFLVNDGQFS